MTSYRVVHEDRHRVVLAKPSGLLTTPPGEPSLIGQAESSFGALHAVSRLDREVTGLVTLTRSPQATQAVLSARASGTYRRGYLALAAGELDADAGEWTGAIGHERVGRRRRVAPDDDPKARPASTGFQVRARVGRALALWLTPTTGRTHQLRVHAAAAGIPLLGDRRYGGLGRVAGPDGRVSLAPRVMLHAAWLTLPPVASLGPLELADPPPNDFQRLWEALGGPAEALTPGP